MRWRAARGDADGQLGRCTVAVTWDVACTSWAARTQLTHDGRDLQLLELARENHPTAHWWYGRIIDGSMVRVQCYLCGERLTTFPTHFPISENQRDRIIRHRREHLARLAPSITATGDTA